MPANGRESVALDRVSKSRSEPHGAQHAKFILGETEFGLTNGANQAGGEVRSATDKIQDFAGVVFHEQAVDGEITAGNIFASCGGVHHLVGVTSIGITDIAAKRGYFNLDSFTRNEHDTELSADTDGIRKQFHDTRGSGIGRHIVISGVAFEQEITDATAHEQSLVTVLLEGCADRIGKFPGIHDLIMR